MSERPIEEVIGWTREHIRGDVGEVVWDAGEQIVCQAEVDDLAAWLDGRVTWIIEHEDSRTIVHVAHELAPPVWHDTIREALVAAVRKVAAS